MTDLINAVAQIPALLDKLFALGECEWCGGTFPMIELLRNSERYNVTPPLRFCDACEAQRAAEDQAADKGYADSSVENRLSPASDSPFSICGNSTPNKTSWEWRFAAISQ